jgi:hypothetical protein
LPPGWRRIPFPAGRQDLDGRRPRPRAAISRAIPTRRSSWSNMARATARSAAASRRGRRAAAPEIYLDRQGQLRIPRLPGPRRPDLALALLNQCVPTEAFFPIARPDVRQPDQAFNEKHPALEQTNPQLQQLQRCPHPGRGRLRRSARLYRVHEAARHARSQGAPVPGRPEDDRGDRQGQCRCGEQITASPARRPSSSTASRPNGTASGSSWDGASAAARCRRPARAEPRAASTGTADADQAAAADRLQELRRPGRPAHRAGPDGDRRPQWLRQIEPARGAALGDGREQRQVDARRRHGGRDLRRHRDAAGARFRRSLDPRRAGRRG